jgi:hypothetical protein
MSPSLKYWDGSAWQTIAGAPGIPGYTPSGKAHSGAFAITADANARFYTPPLTVDFNDFGSNPFSNNGRFTVPVNGRYLIGCSITEMAAGNGGLGIILNSTTVLKRIHHPLVVGADGTKPGMELWDIYNLTAGQDLMIHSWSSGGGSTNILTWNVIRLDAPIQAGLDIAWQNWTPVVKQGGASLAISNTRSRYCQIGKLVQFYTNFAMSAAGAANAINISGFPVPLVAASALSGVFWLNASQLSPPNVTGIIVGVDGVSGQLIMGGQPSNYVGFTPAITLASGNSFMISGMYEAA